MPPAAALPLVSLLSADTRVAQWKQDWEVHRLDLRLPLPRATGRWLIRHGLYARGNDFTSEMSDAPGYEGNSTLKDLWQGKLDSRTTGMAGLRVFVLTRRGTPQGVVAWLHADTPGEPVPWAWFDKSPGHPNHRPKQRLPVARLGHVMAFLKPDHRKQGLVRRTLAECVVPSLESLGEACVDNGVMPVVGASDAMARLMRQSSALPVAQPLTVCQKMRDDVWAMITWAQMYPEKDFPQKRYHAAPQPMPAPERKRSGLRVR